MPLSSTLVTISLITPLPDATGLKVTFYRKFHAKIGKVSFQNKIASYSCFSAQSRYTTTDDAKNVYIVDCKFPLTTITMLLIIASYQQNYLVNVFPIFRVIVNCFLFVAIHHLDSICHVISTPLAVSCHFSFVDRKTHRIVDCFVIVRVFHFWTR